MSSKALADFQMLIDRKLNRQQAYPAYGSNYHFNPAIRLTHADGVLTTHLVYESHSIQQIDGNRTELIISLKDELYPVFISIKFIAYEHEDVITQEVSVCHKEKGIVKIEEISSTYLPIKAHSYYLTQLAGPWGAEANIIEEKLQCGTKVIDSKKGIRTSHGHTPFFLLSLDNSAKEENGKVYAGALAWSGNYKLSFQLDDKNQLHINCGINSFASTYCMTSN